MRWSTIPAHLRQYACPRRPPPPLLLPYLPHPGLCPHDLPSRFFPPPPSHLRVQAMRESGESLCGSIRRSSSACVTRGRVGRKERSSSACVTRGGKGQVQQSKAYDPAQPV